MKHILILIVLCLVSSTFADEPAAGTMIVHPADGAIMVWVPAGSFIMGIDPADAEIIAKDLGFKAGDDLWPWDAYPKRTVYLDGYFIDRCEVTVEQWRKFAAARAEQAKTPAENHSDKPEDQLRGAGTVSWAQAQQYANWAGKTLPDNAHWEKAARGTDGRYYPWGNEKPDETRLLMRMPKGKKPVARHVGLYPSGASPYGALDMLSNQYEWVSEWLEPYANNPQASRMADYSGHFSATLRGGSAYHGPISLYAAKRMGMAPAETHFHLGLRTMWRPPEGYFASDAFTRDKAAVAGRLKELEAFPRAKAGE